MRFRVIDVFYIRYFVLSGLISFGEKTKYQILLLSYLYLPIFLSTKNNGFICA